MTVCFGPSTIVWIISYLFLIAISLVIIYFLIYLPLKNKEDKFRILKIVIGLSLFVIPLLFSLYAQYYYHYVGLHEHFKTIIQHFFSPPCFGD